MMGRLWCGARSRFARAVRSRLSMVFESIASEGADLVHIASMIAWGYDERLIGLTPFAERLNCHEIRDVVDDELRRHFRVVRDRARWVSLSSVESGAVVYSAEGLCMRVEAGRGPRRQLCRLVGFARPIELDGETRVMPVEEVAEATSPVLGHAAVTGHVLETAGRDAERTAPSYDLSGSTRDFNLYHLRARQHSARRDQGERA